MREEPLPISDADQAMTKKFLVLSPVVVLLGDGCGESPPSIEGRSSPAPSESRVSPSASGLVGRWVFSGRDFAYGGDGTFEQFGGQDINSPHPDAIVFRADGTFSSSWSAEELAKRSRMWPHAGNPAFARPR